MSLHACGQAKSRLAWELKRQGADLNVRGMHVPAAKAGNAGCAVAVGGTQSTSGRVLAHGVADLRRAQSKSETMHATMHETMHALHAGAGAECRGDKEGQGRGRVVHRVRTMLG